MFHSRYLAVSRHTFSTVCVPSVLRVSTLITLVSSLQNDFCFTGLIPMGPTEEYLFCVLH